MDKSWKCKSIIFGHTQMLETSGHLLNHRWNLKNPMPSLVSFKMRLRCLRAFSVGKMMIKQNQASTFGTYRPRFLEEPILSCAELESFGERGGLAIPARERFSLPPAVWMEPPRAWTKQMLLYFLAYGRYTKPHRGCDLSRSRFGMRNRWISDVQ